MKTGADTWFFITVDYAFGHALEKDTSDVIAASGGKVLGHVLYPLNTPDFSSFLLQAQSSRAKIVALANAGQDTVNSIKQAAEFGIVAGGQRLAALLLTLAEVHGLGLQAAQGLVLTESYYWDLNDRTRELGERFFKRTGRMPNMIQAGHVFRYVAISQGGEGRRHEGRRCGGEEAEGTARRRRLHLAWACARQWAHGVGPLSVPGQEALGKQTRLGLL